MTPGRPAPTAFHPRRVATLLVGLVLLVAGCSSSGGEGDAAKTTTVETSTGDDGTTTTTPPGATTTDPVTSSTTANTVPPTNSPNTTPPTDPPATTSPSAPTPLTAAQAEAKVHEQGDWDVDLSTYDPAATLSAVEAVAAGAGSSAAPEQIFFFSKGAYLGPATSTPRVASSFEQTADDTITVTYGHYAPTDPFCCPSQPAWTVVFRYSGGKLTTSGEIPAEGQGL